MDQNDQIERIRQELDEVREDARKLASLRSGWVGLLIRYGLWITGLTYLIAGIRLAPQTVPGAGFIELPVWLWRSVYWSTFATAAILWYRPNTSWVRVWHWGVPTIALSFSVAAAFYFTALQLDQGSSLLEVTFDADGQLGNALFLNYILAAQYAYLQTTIFFKAGRPAS